MQNCLLGLGSNVGNSEAILRAAVSEIRTLPNVHVARTSTWLPTPPVGGPADQSDYVNGAVLIETTIAPLSLLAELQQIETRHGRTRDERWGPRTLDIDILLYGNDVSETPLLVLPHPRMTFRRFVLEPAAEIAPKMLHPVIGWPVERLLMHLQLASDLIAIVSPSDALRTELVDLVSRARSTEPMQRPRFETADHHWPPHWTEWLRISPRSTAVPPATERPSPGGLSYAAAAFPKLSVLVDADIAHRGATKLQWSTLVRQPGRGPTLRLQTTDPNELTAEVLAAVDAVWA